MSFDTSAYLRRATGRAKSDVANKLVSMFLHDVSRRLCAKLTLNVNDPCYTQAVEAAFGAACCYCGNPLEIDRAAVEHLDGMNRFRVGLHVPGNVIVACTRCNRAKRRDDSKATLVLAESGWESFLCHDSKNCEGGCNSCAYWSAIWPDNADRVLRLRAAKDRIKIFQANYAPYLELNARARVVLAATIDTIYRECQEFAVTRIKAAVDEVLKDLVPVEAAGVEGVVPDVCSGLT